MLQVINIAILANATGMGGFFPAGLNGVINGTKSSIGSVVNLNAAAAPPPTKSGAFTAAVPSAVRTPLCHPKKP